MYSENLYKDSLAHFGIKGQKKGVRRFQNLDRTWTEEGKKRYGRKSEGVSRRAQRRNERKARREAIRQIKRNSRNRRLLTDEELEAAVKRLQNERRLRELTEQEVKAGRLYTKEILKDIGKRTLPAIGTVGLLYAGKKVAEIYGPKTFSRFGRSERSAKSAIEFTNDLYKYVVRKK